MENCRGELVAGPKIMPAAEMQRLAPAHIPAVNREMERLLDYLTG